MNPEAILRLADNLEGAGSHDVIAALMLILVVAGVILMSIKFRLELDETVWHRWSPAFAREDVWRRKLPDGSYEYKPYEMTEVERMNESQW